MLTRCENHMHNSIEYLHPSISNRPQLNIPETKRVPFRWPAFAVPAYGKGKLPVLKWVKIPKEQPARLRLTISIDVREEKIIQVRLAETNEILGVLDIRYAPVLEPFELIFDQSCLPHILKQGIELAMIKGNKPAWFFDISKDKTAGHAALQPHLLIDRNPDPLQEFYNIVASNNSLQPYGWMEGCVLDGLYDLYNATGAKRFEKALYDHINHFFNDKLQLIYESPRSEPRDGQIKGIESTLPNAVIARINASHPVLKDVVDFWKHNQDKDGCVQDGGTTSAEGSYTVAYPMMTIGTEWRDTNLIEMAIKQVRLRQQRLIHEDNCYLRYYSDGYRTYRNWARGVAWYTLGLVRTLATLNLSIDVSDLHTELSRIAEWITDYQQPNGLWNCFLHEDVPIDTSGSAGMAAAIGIGVKTGLLPEKYLIVSQKAAKGLISYLTPDGFLTGVAQSNRGGELLQQSDYRVLSQMGMGLMAQLMAVLHI